MRATSWARFLVLAVLWGCSFALIKVSISAFTPEQVAFWRLLIGALVLAGVVAVTRTSLPPLRTAGHVVVAAVFGNVLPFLLFAIGEQTATAAIAGVVQGATPLATLALATAAIPAERATARKLVGAIGGFAGLVLVIAPWTAQGLGSLAGQLACVGAAVSYAIGFVYIRRFIAPYKVTALGLTCAQLSLGAVIMAAATGVISGWFPPTAPPAASVICLAILGATSTGLAFVLLNRLIADEGATPASTVNYVVPLFSVLVGALVLGEAVGWNVAVGGIVVVASVAFAQGHISKTTATAAEQPPRNSQTTECC